jgi:hypothetical protein
MTISELEGVVVLGMHRSGTSLVARLVNLVGPSVCRAGDLLVGRTGNPRGHWESRSMNAFNDELLAALGATWYCPPNPEAAGIRELVTAHGARGLATLHRVHPSRPWVWKDPRTSVLMPFWSSVLRGRVAYVVAVRHPLEVGDSLASRDGFTPMLSLSLWERYTRQAIQGASGSPLLMCTYDQVIAEPLAWCARLAGFLTDLGVAAQPNEAAIASFVSDELRHSSRSWVDLGTDGRLSASQLALVDFVTSPTQARAYAPPALPDETPETENTFVGMRSEVARTVPGLSALPLGLVDPALRSKRRETAGLGIPVTVVVATSSGDAERSTKALSPGLPAAAEIIHAGPDGHSGTDERGEVRRVTSASPSAAAELAAGAAAASGRRVVLVASGISSIGVDWHERLDEAFADRSVAVAGMALAGEAGDSPHWGRMFYGTELALAPYERETRVVPLLSEVLCVVDRQVLRTAGGVDPQFDSASAAVAELCLRLWRMGFRSRIVAGPVVRSVSTAIDGANGMGAYDRLRIARLHLGPRRLRDFERRARRRPGYSDALARIAESELERRRGAVDAVSAFTSDQYFSAFPPRFRSAHATKRRVRRIASRSALLRSALGR